MSAREEAVKCFLQGYNCCQAVAAPFAKRYGWDLEETMKICSSFGGGMGRLREVCGAVSGMFFVVGRVKGYSDPKDFEGKKRHYADIRRLAELFREEFGSYVCRDILQNAAVGGEPEERTPQYYRKRPCTEYVGFAAECTEKYLDGAFSEWNGKNN